MKIYFWTVIFLILLLCCSENEELVLQGNLGNLSSKMLLKKSGNEITGSFKYTDSELNKKLIKLQGKMFNDSLEIKEYDDNSNDYNGTFLGVFDGEVYSGYWFDLGNDKKVKFKFYISDNVVTLNINDKIDYELLGDFGEKNLSITKRNKNYLIDFEIQERILGKIEFETDFDKDGFTDVLISTDNGNGNPSSYFIIFYDEKSDSFKSTEEFGYSWSTPTLEKYGDKMSILFSNSSEGVGNTEMRHSLDRYILNSDRSVRLIESDESTPIPALTEIKSSDFNENDKRNGRLLKYDLNGDGETDIIKLEYWERWGRMNWSIKISNGQDFSSGPALKRLGVLSTKSNNTNDLVGDFNTIFKWDGNKYIEK